MKKEKHLRNEKKKIDRVGNFDANIWGKIFVVLGIICFFCLFYLLTLYITNKNDTTSVDNSATSTETNISYDEIMLGRSFSVTDGEYLVLYYDKSDNDISSIYSNLISTYQAKEEHLAIYNVDMSDGFNKKYVSDEPNFNPTNSSELAINGPTLIKFNDGKVEEYLEGEETITSYLN